MIKWLVCINCVLLVEGCSSAVALSHYFRSTDHFRQASSDTRVYFEPGAEHFSSLVAGSLPGAIGLVEGNQRAVFAEGIRVYVCASTTSFKYMTGREVKALTYRNAVFLSPRLLEQPETIGPYLAHELSHLDLLQHRGLYKYMTLPPWFTEGLAVLAANGAGAQTVTAAEAQRAIAKGRHFIPEEAGSPFDFLWPHYGSRWTLEPHMFCRQSQLFVAFIKNSDAKAFSLLVSNLEDGMTFTKSYERAYRRPLSVLWRKYLATVVTTESGTVNLAL